MRAEMCRNVAPAQKNRGDLKRGDEWETAGRSCLCVKGRDAAVKFEW